MDVKQEIENLNSKNTSYTNDINSLKQTTTGMMYDGNTNFNQKTIISDPNEFFIGSMNVKKEINDINTYLIDGLLTTTDLVLNTLNATTIATDNINGIPKTTLATLDATSSIQTQLNSKPGLANDNIWTGGNTFSATNKISSFGNAVYDSSAITNPRIPNGISSGTGDGSSNTLFNNAILSWGTTGFVDTSGHACNTWINHRNGNISTLGNITGNNATFNGAQIRQGAAGYMMAGAAISVSASKYKYGPPFTILTSVISLEIASGVDDKWVVNPGYKIVTYDGGSSSGATNYYEYGKLVEIFDNTNGFVPLIKKPVTPNKAKAVKVYYLGVEVIGVDDP